MYPAWIPFDWTESNQKWLIAFLYQFFAINIQLIQNACNDSYPVSYLMILTTHFHILRLRIENIVKDPKQTEDNYNSLIECIQVYNILIRIVELFQKVISYVTFLQYLVCAMALCSCGLYYIFSSEQNLIRIIYLMVFGLAVITEILIICYLSSNLETETEKLTDSLYNCEWYEQNYKFRKILVIFMERTQKNVVINASGWLNVNLRSFSNMIQTAYSLFAVVRRTKK